MRSQTDAIVSSCTPSRRISSASDYRELQTTRAHVIRSAARGEIAVPCMETLLVRPTLLVANNYNPNSVAADRMNLLMESILDNGFCFPIVTIWDDELGQFVIIDGFHRFTIAGPEWLELDFVPIVVLAHGITKRMAATMQFNRARGVHQVDMDADIVRALAQQGLGDEEIATKLGMDLEAVHRYKQITGVAALFAKSEYSIAWEMVEDAV